MLEHEAKILNVDKSSIEEKLENMGARKILDAVTYIEGFDFDTNTLNTTPAYPLKFQNIVESINALRGEKDMFSQGAYLRLRQEGEKCELIFKRKIKGDSGVKSEVEISVEISKEEWSETAVLMHELGLKKIVVQEKNRTSYSHPPYRYDIDTWPGVPTYLEVEAPTPEGVLEAVALLGIAQDNALSISAAEVFEMYGIRNPRYLLFSEEQK